MSSSKFTGPRVNQGCVSVRTMVGFVERFRKPRLPIVLGSPQSDGVIHSQAPPAPRIATPHVLRNFSYPTNITSSSSPPPSTSPPSSTWDLLGQICNFSPDVVSQAHRDKSAGLEDPFFYTTDRTPYKQLVDLEEESLINPASKHSTSSVTLSIEPAVEKRQRRSTFLGLSSSQVHKSSRL